MNGRLLIANPCSQRTWTELPGDDRRRFCDVCHTHVHALDLYSGEERAELWRVSRGRVCGYIKRPGLPPPTRRQLLVSAILALASPLCAQDREIQIIVTDAAGGVLPGAEVSLLDARGVGTAVQRSGASGDVRWTGLPVGTHRFRVALAGFEPTTLTVSASSRATEPVIAVLRVGAIGDTVVLPEGKRRRRRWWRFGL